ncbi:hypothetical protein DESC_240066 [Desulfosarcina cetonica]|nr:hypothetical protein DESC_240066 [Desulfosarcina cetonica]
MHQCHLRLGLQRITATGPSLNAGGINARRGRRVRLLCQEDSNIDDWLLQIRIIHRDKFGLRDLSHTHPKLHRL